MAFCANCGSEVQGKFCAKCGTPLAAPAGPPPPGPAPGGPSYSTPGAVPQAAAGGMEENMAAALCYLLGILTGVLFLVIEPYNKNRNIRFHAFQSIFAGIGVIALIIALSIVSGIIVLLPFIGGVIYSLLWAIFGIGVLVLWLMLMYKAYNKEKFVLPVIGPLAEKQA